MGAPQHTERAHALLSASGSTRWLNCTPSARLEESLNIKDNSSDFAAEGTLAHELAEIELAFAVAHGTHANYVKILRTIQAHRLYKDDMPEHVETYTGYVLESLAVARKTTSDAVLLLEERVDLTEYIPESFGSCDAIIIADGVMEVIDLKYGLGVLVSAQDNSQLKLYALGALHAYGFIYDVHTVKLTIVQPRRDHVSSQDISADDLLAFGEDVIKPKAEAAFAGLGEFEAGDHCKWCKAKPRCKKLAEKVLEAAKHEFSDPTLLSNEALAEVYKTANLLSAWVTTVSGYMLEQALAGEHFQGFKVVRGRASRSWIDTDKALDHLSHGWPRNKLVTEKFKGIGDIEKLLGKKLFEGTMAPFIHKPEGKPTLVEEADKRQAIIAADDFKD